MEERDVAGSDVLRDEDGDIFREEVLESFEEDGFLALFGAVEVGGTTRRAFDRCGSSVKTSEKA